MGWLLGFVSKIISRVLITAQCGDDASGLHVTHASTHWSCVLSGDGDGSSSGGGGGGGFHSSQVEDKTQFCSIC